RLQLMEDRHYVSAPANDIIPVMANEEEQLAFLAATKNRLTSRTDQLSDSVGRCAAATPPVSFPPHPIHFEAETIPSFLESHFQRPPAPYSRSGTLSATREGSKQVFKLSSSQLEASQLEISQVEASFASRIGSPPPPATPRSEEHTS